MNDDNLTKLVDDHWKYIEALLNAHWIEERVIQVCEFHYKSAFRHGFKHAKEEELERAKQHGGYIPFNPDLVGK